MSRLAVLPTDRPEVTVVMVTFNAWEWTERALAALVDNTDPCFELIVVDNASSDGTAERLAAVDGATVLCNPVNRGFGPAVNQAVMRARAPYVALLNNDAVVHPGWLSPLCAILDAEPDVAAVAPRLLHLDGSVQEAGSIVWGDGEVWPYGALQPAHRPEYRFRRDVDYASAACLLVRRASFVDAGGFDPGYAPAYFEDVDLCLTLWNRGLRTVCQPASEVTHASGASSQRVRIGEMQARNRPRFLARWAPLLAERPPSPVHWDPEDVLPGRDFRCADRVLVVGDFVPDARQELLRRLLLRLVELWPRARITYLALDSDDAERAAPPLLAAGVELAWPGEDLAAWLTQRRHHYGLVLGTSWAAAMPPTRGLLAASQPLAHRALLLDERVETELADDGYREAVRSQRLLLCRSEEQGAAAAAVAPAARVALLDDLVAALVPLGMAPTTVVRGTRSSTG